MRTKSILLFCIIFISSNSIMAQLKPVDYNDGEQKLSGLVTKPLKALKSKAGILILPAWMGIDDHSKDVATELSNLGYFAFVADIYGVGNKPTNTSEAGKQAGFYKKNVLDYQRRIQLALDQLVKNGANADEIVIIGYCFGGTGAIEAARSAMKIKGVVSFHGGLGKDEARSTETISAKILVLHGADDNYVPETEVRVFQNEMRKAKADWQMIYYANAVHAFTEKKAGNDNSKGAAYNENADKRSWKAMKSFLEEIVN